MPRGKRFGDDRLFDGAGLPRHQKLAWRHGSGKGSFPSGVVHGTPVVRINQALVPELAALVHVRNAWRGEAQQRLGEAVDRAGRPKAFGKGNNFGEYRPRGIECVAQKFLAGELVLLIGRGPF